MPSNSKNPDSARRLLEAGVHAFLQHAKNDRPRTAQELEAIVAEISQLDAGAATMINLALRENSAAQFIEALQHVTRT
jgi:hypothetical protein